MGFVVLGVIVFVMFVWVGYGVMDDGVCGMIYFVVDIVYLLVVGMWVGVLVVFVLLLLVVKVSMLDLV